MHSCFMVLLVLGLHAVLASSLPFDFGTPVFFGSGCPADTVRVVPSSDGKTFSVLFSQFEAATSGTKTRDRKACGLAVPVNVRPGFSVAIFKVDYRGNVYQPNSDGQSHASFDTEFFFAGEQGPIASAKWDSFTNKNVLLSLDAAAWAWSPCGASTNFRINSAITAFKARSTAGDVQIAIDSSDSNVAGFRYYYATRQC